MSSIRKRGSKWNVQIRRSGLPLLSKTFIFKTDAEKWSKATEAALDRGETPHHKADVNITLSQILKRYRDNVVPFKKSAPVEHYIIGGFLKADLASITIKRLKVRHFAQYRDERLKSVTGSTVARELSVINQALQIAINEWEVPLEINPLSKVKSPSVNRSRERRLKAGEYNRLVTACSLSQNPWLKPIVLLAVETAMRRGELLALNWEFVRSETCTCCLPLTKNGSSREIPLSLNAHRILDDLPRSLDGRVFPLSATALRGLWSRAIRRAGLDDLRFHDLRHEATSRFFEKGLNVMEVATITGHKDLRMLQRYTHLRAEDLAKKLG